MAATCLLLSKGYRRIILGKRRWYLALPSKIASSKPQAKSSSKPIAAGRPGGYVGRAQSNPQ